MIILIVSENGRKYWTREYKEEGDFIVFDSETKEGISRKVKLSKNNIVEITSLDRDFKNEEDKGK
jgi:hypothetical protein